MADVTTRLDRFMAGELSRAEERELAQAALHDGELFDALMTASTTRAALRLEGAGDAVSVPMTARGNRVARFLRSPAGLGAVVAAAAAVVVMVLSPVAHRRAAPPESPATAARFQTSRPAAPGAPALPAPVLLTASLEDLAGTAAGEFRSAPSATRPPNAEGAITSVRGDEAWAALGSVDGVTQGAVLQIFRGRDRTNAIGTITAAAVFRDRLRGSTSPTSSPRPGDVAVAPPRLVVAALRQHMASLIAQGDIAAARATGDRAAALSQAPDVSISDRRAVLALLGALERRSGRVDRAVEHLRAAAALFDGIPAPADGERADILTELAAALVEAHQPEAAGQTLRLAQRTASGLAAGRIDNNLGAVAAIRGDREAAAALYRSALGALGDTPATADERRAIEKNLADLTPVR